MWCNSCGGPVPAGCIHTDKMPKYSAELERDRLARENKSLQQEVGVRLTKDEARLVAEEYMKKVVAHREHLKPVPNLDEIIDRTIKARK